MRYVFSSNAVWRDLFLDCNIRNNVNMVQYINLADKLDIVLLNSWQIVESGENHKCTLIITT